MVSLVYKNSFLFHILISLYAPPRDTQSHSCNISPTSYYTSSVFCSSAVILHTTKKFILLIVKCRANYTYSDFQPHYCPLGQ
jgi:hypothetical protein